MTHYAGGQQRWAKNVALSRSFEANGRTPNITKKRQNVPQEEFTYTGRDPICGGHWASRRGTRTFGLQLERCRLVRRRAGGVGQQIE
jgi:hypothetical protein